MEEFRGIANKKQSKWGKEIEENLDLLKIREVEQDIREGKSGDEICTKLKDGLDKWWRKEEEREWESIVRSSYNSIYKEIMPGTEGAKFWMEKVKCKESKEIWARLRCGNFGRAGKKGYKEWSCRLCGRWEESLAHLLCCGEVYRLQSDENRDFIVNWKGDRREDDLRERMLELLNGKINERICEYLRVVEMELKKVTNKFESKGVMETWGFIKEEPSDDECYAAKSNRYNISDSYSTLGSKELYDVKIEEGESCSTYDFNEPYDVKIESTEELLRSEKNNNQETRETTTCQYSKLSIPIVPLEYSQNEEVKKYLMSLKFPITSSIKLQAEERSTELHLDLKTESVELETLNENTVVESSKDYRYASPWDFVLVDNTYSQNNSQKNPIKKQLKDSNLSKDVITEYEGGMLSQSLTWESSLSRRIPKILDTRILKEKFIQKTLNYEVVWRECKKRENKIPKAPVQLPNCGFFGQVYRLEPRSTDSNSPGDKSFSCKSYNQNFLKKSCLIQHKKNKHSDAFPTTVRPQKEIKQTVKNFACEVCRKSGILLSTLHRHCATHDARKQYECDICKKQFKLKAYLREHIPRHALERYPCNFCSKVYGRKSTLQRHMKMHYVEPVELGKFTPQTHTSQLGLKNKKNTKANVEEPLKLFKCDICGQRFEDKSSMNVHIEFLHIEMFGEHAEKSLRNCFNSSLNKPYQCRTCRKRYTQSSHLRRHQESHLPNKSHFCELCNQQFSTTSSLSRHLMNKHNEVRSTRKRAGILVKKNLEKLTCKICGKSSTNLGDLRRHCATHDARKPFECDICHKQFAVKGYLYAHILTHGNSQLYPCKQCARIYRRKSSLQRHICISHSLGEKNTKTTFS